jgi:hypothetical protein
VPIFHPFLWFWVNLLTQTQNPILHADYGPTRALALPAQHLPVRRSERQRRSAVPDYYGVYLQERRHRMKEAIWMIPSLFRKLWIVANPNIGRRR